MNVKDNGVMLSPINVKRALNETTRKQDILVSGVVYSLHITKNREVLVTDNRDYGKVYALMSLDFYNQMEREGYS